MNTSPKLALFLALVISVSTSVAEELCPLEKISDLHYEDIRCQFYLGTTAYRAEYFEVAAAHWVQISLSDYGDSETAKEYSDLAKSTLAYLKYHGLGVAQDREGAVVDWRETARTGDIAAHTHLGHAYFDPEFQDYDPVRGMAWYLSVRTKFTDTEVLDSTEKESYDTALDRAAKRRGELSEEDFKEAERLAAKIDSAQ
ncbi:MAG: hypothetical protein MO852_16090 [Candidatus Devosia euplotis]|nr:hypothetical protein [Candidatus Devosia euplotis]